MLRTIRAAGYLVSAGAFLAPCVFGGAARAEAPPANDGISALATMSLEDLAELEISSVSKRTELRTSAAAAIYVITQDDIRRSAATSLPDLLRMAPGIHVANLDANKFSVSARGFSGRYSNSVLVLLDGRSIYTPLFSGTEWENMDVMLEDIDRIEIIRGPGGALWGANAVNGVINIVTKRASETQGGLLSLGAGTEYPGLGAFRYGGMAGEHGAYRLHLRYLQRDEALYAGGHKADDDSINLSGGARWDWDWDDTRFMLAARFHGADIGQSYALSSRNFGQPDQINEESYYSAGSLLGRWGRTLNSGAELSIQAYYDRWESNGFELDEDRDTLDLEVQYRMAPVGRHEFMFGGGFRYYADRTRGTDTTSLRPSTQRKRLFSAFIQDRISFLDDELVLTLGTKLEHNDFTGVEIQPSARLAWTPNERHTIWGAISRAVRTPSLAEEAGRIESIHMPGAVVSLYGNEDFDAEDLLAVEAGYRIRPMDKLQIDLALFYNRYKNLRSLELGAPFLEPYPLPLHVAIPFYARNNLEGETYGLEMALDWQPASWWRVRMNYTLLEMDLDLRPTTIDLISGGVQESSPEQQVFLANHFDLSEYTELDITFRYTDRLSALAIQDYITMDVRLAWRPSDDFEIALIAHDLLDGAHQEFDSMFVNTVPTQVQRGIYGKLTWRF